MIGLLPLSDTAVTLLSVAALWLCGFLMTRLTKALRLPNVTGYILAGILAGPYVLNLIPENVTASMDFLIDAALGFIAFGVGRYLRLDALRRSGWPIVLLTLLEALAAAAAVTLSALWIFHLPVPFCLLLGAIGSATAPASSLMTIRQYRAKGEFVRILIQVVALDDVVALLAFSVCTAVINHGGGGVATVLKPLAFNLCVLAAGLCIGWALGMLITPRRSREHSLTLVCAAIFGLAALSSALEVSPLLGSMLIGAVYANMHEDKTLFKAVQHFTPPIMMLFFVLSGMRLNLSVLASAGWIGLGYFFFRIAGKYAGASLGARLIHAPDNVRRYLGLTLIPQAGVSIGLAVLGQRLLPASEGALLSTIILSSSVLYEMIGPVCAKEGLILSGAIPARKTALKAKAAPKSARTGKNAGKKTTSSGSKSDRASEKGKSKPPPAQPTTPVATHYSPNTQRMFPMRRESDKDERKL